MIVPVILALVVYVPWSTIASFTKIQKDFPCDVSIGGRSLNRPGSVHELKPGDIDIIAAIGDSLSSATTAYAITLYDTVATDFRGVSWIAGGQGTWREHLTLPNILKLYNPQLFGYSLGTGSSSSRNSQFNIAVNGAMDQDLFYQAKVLVKRMKNDPRVNFNNHWKLISVWIGTNDICTDYCYDTSQGVSAHIKYIKQTLDYLYENVPKSFVMLISSPYVPSYATLKDIPNLCLSTLPVLCSCLFGGDMKTKIDSVTHITRVFQQAEKKLAESKRYKGRDDFTVEFQPTFLNSYIPTYKNRNGQYTTDYSYLALDCVHFSQKLHEVAANAIWNNLLEPINNKTTTWNPKIFDRFLCPTEETPYLYTYKNSEKTLLII